jgi:hypothetical protein
MTLTQLAPPYPIFTDKNGDPLDAGYLYFGVANLNPETNPIQVYYDAAFTQPAAQPLRTSNGYVMRNGSPALIYANAQFSVTVRNKNNELVIYSPVGYGIVPGTSASSTDQMTYDQGATGAVPRVLTSRLQDYVSVKDFGAVGNGTTDDTAAIQAAITYGQTSGKTVYLPAADYLITTSIVISAPVTFVGDGWESSLLVSASFSASSDAISINPTAYTENVIIRDMSIRPVSGTPARYGIGVDITNYGVAYCDFTGLRIAALGNYCFATIPNATPLIDGFFTSVIDRCVFIGGIKLDKAGDSIRITNNTITGPRIGVYVDLLHGSFDGGPHGLLIDGNNITSNGGALYVLNCTMGVFSNNNVELPTPSGVTNNAMIDLEGINSFSLSVNGMALINNFIGSAVAGYDTVRINYGRNVLIFGNYVARPIGAKSYNITANATGTRILQNDDALDETFAAMATDLGTGTMFERSFGGDLQQTLNLRFIAASKTIKWNDSAGTARSCLQLSATDDFFYVGPDGATALTGGMIFRLNGAEVGRWSPTGNLSIAGAGDGVTLKSPDGLVTKTLTINNAGSLVLV